MSSVEGRVCVAQVLNEGTMAMSWSALEMCRQAEINVFDL